VVGHLEASKAGHALHAALGRAVLDAPDAWALVTMPQLPVMSLPDLPPPAALAPQRR
jgi:UDP-3-O-acyl-N-acetylglucosamine deacetylase